MSRMKIKYFIKSDRQAQDKPSTMRFLDELKYVVDKLERTQR